MKNKIIALLKDETISKIERYNALLNFLSQKRGLFSIRNLQTGYSDSKYDSLIFEVKKDYEITDLEIYEFSRETIDADPADDSSGDPADDTGSQDLTDEEKAAKQAIHEEEAAKRQQCPELQAFYKELENDDHARTGVKLHDEYPFLDDENTPDEIKALVTDKFAAYRNFAKNHGALVDGLEENEAQQKIYELAKAAVDQFTLENDIKKELDFYKEQGKVLGKHPKLNNLVIAQEINELTEAGLVEMKNASQKNASKARVEIEKKGTNEGREKRVHEWTLKNELATARLEKEFKKN